MAVTLRGGGGHLLRAARGHLRLPLLVRDAGRSEALGLLRRGAARAARRRLLPLGRRLLLPRGRRVCRRAPRRAARLVRPCVLDRLGAHPPPQPCGLRARPGGRLVRALGNAARRDECGRLPVALGQLHRLHQPPARVRRDRAGRADRRARPRAARAAPLARLQREQHTADVRHRGARAVRALQGGRPQRSRALAGVGRAHAGATARSTCRHPARHSRRRQAAARPRLTLARSIANAIKCTPLL
mmetsp:Transcript_11578/g.29310  ORF Transcript_11578/g.29310 Transcript_11578/m.29310 type:complete len:244 (+) Transcript_11578:166-897(+)